MLLHQALRRVAVGFALATACGTSAPAQEGLPEFPLVSTVAGSGVSGLADGSAANAQFVFPTGVAIDGHGNTYVADAGGERIKEISPDGTVRTIAGGGPTSFGGLWVEGGYLDGPASQARFSVPMGVAADSAGAVYVADAGNHVIRKIKDGVVSTFAGDQSAPGDAVGALKDSRFRRPDGLAFDREGDLYVADLQGGIREITPQGQVVALDLKVDRPTGISVYENGSEKYVAVADYQGIVLVFPHRDPLRVPLRTIEGVVEGAEGSAPLGYPSGIAMLGPHSMLYTDPRTDTIRLYCDLQTRVVAGRSYDDVENDGGGFRDASGSAALFNAPLGVAAEADGSVLVADAGNRRIRRVSRFDVRSAVNPQLDEIPELDPAYYNIVFVGNSFAWFDTDFTHSIAGNLERDLERFKSHGKPIRVTVVSSPGLALQPEETLFKEYIGDADFTVLLLNSLTYSVSYPDLMTANQVNVAEVVSRSSASLRRDVSYLSKPKNVVGVIHPWPWEFSGSETTYHRLYEKIGQEWLFPVPSFHRMLIDTVVEADIPLIDFWTALTEHEAAADRVPYFGSANPHFSRAGRELLAQTVADWLIARHPWDEGTR